MKWYLIAIKIYSCVKASCIRRFLLRKRLLIALMPIVTEMRKYFPYYVPALGTVYLIRIA